MAQAVAKYTTSVAESSVDGAFKRTASTYRNFISRDGSTGFKAEANRYHLYISLACPWANRCLAMRHLKGLTGVIGVTVVSPVWDIVEHETQGKGWVFPKMEDHGASPDPLNGVNSIRELYLLGSPEHSGKCTVPVLWDKLKKVVVNNESSEIIRMFNSEFQEFASKDSIDYYPAELHKEIDEINGWVYETINDGVYRCGFARSQEAYEKAFRALFDSLSRVESILSTKRYLCGDKITEADIRLFMTVIRFDPVYHTYFKTNLHHITYYPNLSQWTNDIYQHKELGTHCIDLHHIKQHYFRSHQVLNAFGIVPLGPELPNYSAPHDRETKFAAKKH